jgi:septal ring factor EnvC (AmiA/AmiB activator)
MATMEPSIEEQITDKLEKLKAKLSSLEGDRIRVEKTLQQITRDIAMAQGAIIALKSLVKKNEIGAV